eukprot:4925302-Karenia_brevis.AAC.1
MHTYVTEVRPRWSKVDSKSTPSWGQHIAKLRPFWGKVRYKPKQVARESTECDQDDARWDQDDARWEVGEANMIHPT